MSGDTRPVGLAVQGDRFSAGEHPDPPRITGLKSLDDKLRERFWAEADRRYVAVCVDPRDPNYWAVLRVAFGEDI